jgi:hypothetical protein
MPDTRTNETTDRLRRREPISTRDRAGIFCPLGANSGAKERARKACRPAVTFARHLLASGRHVILSLGRCRFYGEPTGISNGWSVAQTDNKLDERQTSPISSSKQGERDDPTSSDAPRNSLRELHVLDAIFERCQADGFDAADGVDELFFDPPGPLLCQRDGHLL